MKQICCGESEDMHGGDCLSWTTEIRDGKALESILVTNVPILLDGIEP